MTLVASHDSKIQVYSAYPTVVPFGDGGGIDLPDLWDFVERPVCLLDQGFGLWGQVLN